MTPRGPTVSMMLFHTYGIPFQEKKIPHGQKPTSTLLSAPDPAPGFQEYRPDASPWWPR